MQGFNQKLDVQGKVSEGALHFIYVNIRW